MRQNCPSDLCIDAAVSLKPHPIIMHAVAGGDERDQSTYHELHLNFIRFAARLIFFLLFSNMVHGSAEK